MIQFPGIVDAADAVRKFVLVNAAAIPAPVARATEGYTGTGASPVDLVERFIESVYTNRGTIPAAIRTEALEIAAGGAGVFDADGFHDRLYGRARKIHLALRRDSGEKAAAGRPWPKADTDPPAKDEWRPAPEAVP